MSDLTKYIVHRFYSEKYDEAVLFRGTEQECIDFINSRPDDEISYLEICELFPGEKYYDGPDGEL